MNNTQQPHSKGIMIIVIILVILLAGLGSVMKKQWDARKNAPRIAREQKLANARRHRKQLKAKRARELADKEADKQDTAQQKAIDKEADTNPVHKKNNKKRSNKRQIRRHVINPNRLIQHQVGNNAKRDRSFTSRQIYNPKRNTVYITFNHHGLVLMQNKRWRASGYRNLRLLNQQEQGLRRVNKHLKVKLIK